MRIDGFVRGGTRGRISGLFSELSGLGAFEAGGAWF